MSVRLMTLNITIYASYTIFRIYKFIYGKNIIFLYWYRVNKPENKIWNGQVKMSNMKPLKKPNALRNKKKNELPIVVFVWIIGLTFLGYLIGRIVLDSYPHPYHWAVGLIGGVLGLVVGWIWYKLKGDIY